MRVSEIQAQRILKFTNVLRSGVYPQGVGRLRIRVVTDDAAGKQDQFCCLGVGCEVALHEGVGHRVGAKYYNSPIGIDGVGNRGTQLTLPWNVAQWYGFSEPNPDVKVLCGQIPGDGHSYWCEDCQGERRDGCDNLITVPATDANDDLRLSFPEIADAFERMYLGEVQHGQSQ